MRLRARVHAAVWRDHDDGPPVLRPGAVYPLLVVVILVLGLNWPLMVTGLRSISALWMSAFRLIGAALTLFVVTVATGRLERPPRADYPILGTVALRLALVFVLVFSALEIVPAGRSSILVWTASLWTVPIAAVFLDEHMSPIRWAGLLAGIAGVLFVFEPTRFDWTDGRVVVGHAMLLGAALLNAGVSVHVRRHRWVTTPLRLLPWQMLAGAVPITAIAVALEGFPSIAWTPGLVAVVVYQGTAASGLALWGQITVLRSHPAISTNLALMAVPVVGIVSSAIFLDEALTVLLVVGGGLVLTGVAMNKVADARRAPEVVLPTAD